MKIIYTEKSYFPSLKTEKKKKLILQKSDEVEKR